MFGDLALLFNEVSKVNINISYKVKIGILILVLIVTTTMFYVYKDNLDKSVFRDSYQWYYLITLINLINIITIYYYYNYKEDLPGLPGVEGEKGKKGNRGKFKNCSYCKHNLFIQKTNKYNPVCEVVKSTKMTDLRDNVGELTYSRLFDYFGNNNIDYSSIVNNGLLQKPINYDYIDKDYHKYFKTINDIMYDDSTIIDMFTYLINKDIGSNRGNYYGTIIRPEAKFGYGLFGDTVKGGKEDFKLNAFLVSGGGGSDLLYPKKINPIVKFKVDDSESKKKRNYVVWRGELIQEKMFPDLQKGKGSQILKRYHSLGDIIMPENVKPDKNLMSMIDETCLKKVDNNLLDMIFIYSDSNYKTLNKRLNKYQKNKIKREFQIDKPTSMINMFSIWRTPMNTLLVSYVNESTPFYNNTLVFNLVEGRSDLLDEYGNVNIKTKKMITSRLKNIKLSVLQVIIILVHYNNIILKNKILYNLNKYMEKFDDEARNKIDELSNSSRTKLSDIVEFIENTENRYNESNIKRQKKIFDVSETKKKQTKEYELIGYDYIEKEKKIPSAIKNLYKEFKRKEYDISRESYNITNLYQLVLEIFPNGLNERIAIDNEGLAEGGEILNYAQEWVFYFCKVVLPPTKTVYQVKNDCIGTLKIDDERSILENNLEKQVRKYNSLMRKYKDDGDKYCNNWSLVQKFQDLSFKIISQHVGHIKDFQDKIETFNFEEFTKSRLKIILEEYFKMNDYMIQDCKEFENEISTLR